jgi:hypothetical protein
MEGFKPSTLALTGRHSITELHANNGVRVGVEPNPPESQSRTLTNYATLNIYGRGWI